VQEQSWGFSSAVNGKLALPAPDFPCCGCHGVKAYGLDMVIWGIWYWIEHVTIDIYITERPCKPGAPISRTNYSTLELTFSWSTILAIKIPRTTTTLGIMTQPSTQSSPDTGSSELPSDLKDSMAKETWVWVNMPLANIDDLKRLEEWIDPLSFYSDQAAWTEMWWAAGRCWPSIHSGVDSGT
jgi:hypothetical protein